MTTPLEFTAAEHTQIIDAVIQHPLHIIRQLKTPKGQPPTDKEVIDAALKVRAFSPEIRGLFERMKDALPAIEAAKRAASPETLATVAQLEVDLQHKTLDEALKVVQDTAGKVPDLADNLAFVEEMMKDGADTIYSPTYPPAEYLYPATATFGAGTWLVAVAVADACGGALAGGGGAVVASTTGAITATVIEAVS